MVLNVSIIIIFKCPEKSQGQVITINIIVIYFTHCTKPDIRSKIPELSGENPIAAAYTLKTISSDT